MGAFAQSTPTTVWHIKKPKVEEADAQKVEAPEAQPAAQEKEVEEETLQEDLASSFPKKRGRRSQR